MAHLLPPDDELKTGEATGAQSGLPSLVPTCSPAACCQRPCTCIPAMHPAPVPPVPARPRLAAAYEKGVKQMGQDISRIGIISLVSAADTAAPLAPPGLGLRRDASGALAPPAGEQQQRQRTGLTAEALELAAVPYAAPLTTAAAGNQKLLLLAAFLQVRALRGAELHAVA